jgi:hypothetical protein
MKTALLFIGNIRTWEKSREFFNSSFSHLNPDIFVSTYDLQYGYHPYIKKKINDENDVILSKDNIDKLFEGYNVREIEIENSIVCSNIFQQEIPKMNVNFREHPHCYLQYRKLKKAVDLMKNFEEKNNHKYDFVCKVRCDIVHEKIDMNLSENDVLISSGNLFPNDVFFASKRNNFISMIDFIMNEFYDMTYLDSHERPPHNLLLNATKYNKLNFVIKPIMKYVIRKNQIQYY